MDDLDTFLAGHPPFDALPPEQLRDLTVQATLHDQDPGTVLLVEDGPPATGMWVVVTGSMDVVHSGEVIQVLEPGECFGHPSLLDRDGAGVHGACARALELAAVPARAPPGRCWPPMPACPTSPARCASA